MGFVLFISALIQQGQFEQGSNIRALTGQGYEERDIDRIILRALAVGIEVDGPFVTPDDEGFTGDVFPDSHSLGEGVTVNCEVMGAIDGVSN